MKTNSPVQIKPERIKKTKKKLGITFEGWQNQAQTTTLQELKNRIKKGYKHR